MVVTRCKRSVALTIGIRGSVPPLKGHKLFRRFSASGVTALTQDPSLVDTTKATSRWSHQSAVVYPSVISKQQEELLQEILALKFQRRRYERNHWDAAIQTFKEVELFDEDEDLKAVLQPIRRLLEHEHSDEKLGPRCMFSGGWLPCHAIDLHESGALNAHVDSVRFSGNIVAGLSLSSDSIMRLRPAATTASETSDADGKATDTYVDLLLPTRSLYVLSGESRYDYTHELLPSGSMFGGTTLVERGRRLSVIFRDSKRGT